MNGASSRTEPTLKDLEVTTTILLAFGMFGLTFYIFSQTKYTKAAKAELNRELDRAFRLYIEVAQDYLHLGGTTTNPSTRTTCKANASKALKRAELIKQTKPNVAPVFVDRFSDRMASTRDDGHVILLISFSEEQFAVLRSSSVINDVRYPFWSEASTSR